MRWRPAISEVEATPEDDQRRYEEKAARIDRRLVLERFDGAVNPSIGSGSVIEVGARVGATNGQHGESARDALSNLRSGTDPYGKGVCLVTVKRLDPHDAEGFVDDAIENYIDDHWDDDTDTEPDYYEIVEAIAQTMEEYGYIDWITYETNLREDDRGAS